MLKSFTVENFKNFDQKLTLNFSDANRYEFNDEVYNQQNGCLSKAVIYGENGSGKSNLGLALFDLTTHLTDNQVIPHYDHYTNLNLQSSRALFDYEFVFDGVPVSYQYAKKSTEQLIEEKLIINGKTVLYYDFLNNEGDIHLKGAENLHLSNSHSNISRVKYAASNAILDSKDETNRAFLSFMSFVNRMLLFYSLDSRGYQGFRTGSESISDHIIKSGKLKDFESFLTRMRIPYHLEEKVINGSHQIYCRFKNGDAELFSIASSGTKSLALFYYWYIQMQDASFVFIDEFDAFYHFDLAREIVSLLKQLKNQQIILTTHNTDLLSNDLLRPDCYYILQDNQIKSLPHLTDKELRRAHNLQKMYKAGAFHE